MPSSAIWTCSAVALIMIYFWPRLLSSRLRRLAGVEVRPPVKEGIDSLTQHDIYHIAFLLHQKLPMELVPQILDSAECWLKSTTHTDERIAVGDQDLLNHDDEDIREGAPYLLSPPLGLGGSSGQHPVRKVVFTITSKDQGYSWDTEYHGTYENSWTWFEAAVRTTDDRNAARIGNKRIISNVHAGQSYKTHVISLSYDSAKKEDKVWVEALARGQYIELSARAKYPGWTCFAKYAQIDVYSAAVR
ncbi:hypothetical protein EJ08DRAFT_162548 [Tothia fuscella]|uniref:Uncharacterized protein n=1 Tax=Tothia fuscella TaxID=1048955 RepID=A0A9P4NVD2_9PEZI|nr:hypothetical protein EJ08DRAFT_162548 [Tothia fuscella]